MNETLTRAAETALPIHPLLSRRWSTRAFDPAARVSDEQVTALLEAARWAPSAANTQPWRFLVARRPGAAFDTVFATLAGGNQPWAAAASALVVVAAQTVADDGAPQPWAAYDTGQAVAHLSVQAEHEGLSLHQMGGFDQAALRSALALPTGLDPLVVIAVGVRDPAAVLPEPYAGREVAPRARRPLEELLLGPPTSRLR